MKEGRQSIREKEIKNIRGRNENLLTSKLIFGKTCRSARTMLPLNDDATDLTSYKDEVNGGVASVMNACVRACMNIIPFLAKAAWWKCTSFQGRGDRTGFASQSSRRMTSDDTLIKFEGGEGKLKNEGGLMKREDEERY